MFWQWLAVDKHNVEYEMEIQLGNFNNLLFANNLLLFKPFLFNLTVIHKS